MSNPRDEIDAWLDADVEPLAPLPGSFERVSKRARRRKAARAIVSAAGAAVVIVAVAVVPQVVKSLRQGSTGPISGPVAVGGLSSTARPSVSRSRGGGKPASHSATPEPTLGTSLSPTTSGTVPPDHFRPTSITQIGNGVGAVLGQAGIAGHCPIVPDDCTSIAGTSNFGKSWYGISAPVAGAPAGSTGVSQLRYLNFHYGWAFGPSLYATADGGATWTGQSPAGLRVTDLETAGNRAFALFARCTGTGSQYTANCTRYSLYSSAAGSGTWQAVAVPPTYRAMTSGSAGQATAASLILASGTAANPEAGAGYVLAPSGELLRGPLVVGRWQAIGHIPRSCQVGTAQASGQPAGTQLASGSAAAPQLVLSCDGPASGGSGLQTKSIYTSPDGATWQLAGVAPGAGTATSLAAASGGLVVLATSAGIDYSADGGAHWQTARFTPSAPPRGFSYIGMTTATQGVAVPADASLGEVFTTIDSGRTWQASPIAPG